MQSIKHDTRERNLAVALIACICPKRRQRLGPSLKVTKDSTDAKGGDGRGEELRILKRNMI